MHLTTIQVVIFVGVAMCNVLTAFQLLRATNRAENNLIRTNWLLRELEKSRTRNVTVASDPGATTIDSGNDDFHATGNSTGASHG